MQTPLGFLQIKNMPSDKELWDYYNNKYHELKIEGKTGYTQEEIIHKDIICKEMQFFISQDTRTFLDLGTGEGFFMNFFDKLGLDVTGIDFSSDGVTKNFPHLLDRLIVGNLYHEIEKLCAKNNKYDAIVCNNVIEHVKDPIDFINKIKSLLSPSGICRLSVPNDNSLIQNLAINKGYAKKEFWKSYPDHLNYFNCENFIFTLSNSGFKIIDMLADFPIDIFLLNQDSNYQQSPTLGRNCHFAKTMLENAIASESIEKIIHLRRGFAAAGIGRVVTAYCK